MECSFNIPIAILQWETSSSVMNLEHFFIYRLNLVQLNNLLSLHACTLSLSFTA